MTQTTPRLFPAEIHVRLIPELATDQLQIKAFDDATQPEGEMIISTLQAQMLMRDLAKVLGATVITEGQKQDLGLMLNEAVSSADRAKDSVTGDYGYDTGYQAAAQSSADTLRDLRSDYRRAGIIV